MHLSFYFLSPVHLRKRSDRMALVGTWYPVKVDPPQIGYLEQTEWDRVATTLETFSFYGQKCEFASCAV